jgi:hypothetical protein
MQNKMGGIRSTYGETETAYKKYVRRNSREDTTGETWKDNIKVDIKKNDRKVWNGLN